MIAEACYFEKEVVVVAVEVDSEEQHREEEDDLVEQFPEGDEDIGKEEDTAKVEAFQAAEVVPDLKDEVEEAYTGN